MKFDANLFRRADKAPRRPLQLRRVKKTQITCRQHGQKMFAAQTSTYRADRDIQPDDITVFFQQPHCIEFFYRDLMESGFTHIDPDWSYIPNPVPHEDFRGFDITIEMEVEKKQLANLN